ncbi:GIY-YIG nuclease family protein [Burkholderia sp. Ac-20379]|nr:GIY-YIG nuclease family protein [Burkholderia sp. Ac-20379]
MSWFLYLIECEDGSVYTGITTDVDARFAQHANGTGARYTRARKPRAVLAWFPLADRSSASRAEYWVKRLTPVQKRALASGQRTLESVLPVVAVEAEAADDAADTATAAEIVAAEIAAAAVEPAESAVAGTAAIVSAAPVDALPPVSATRRAARRPRTSS